LGGNPFQKGPAKEMEIGNPIILTPTRLKGGKRGLKNKGVFLKYF